MFNVGLYKEGLRKTRTPGFIVVATMLLGAIMYPIARLSSHAINLQHMTTQPDSWRWFEPILRISGTDTTFSIIIALIATPLIILSMFSFLNARNSSDFYHAIPHKRETLFGSFLLASLTWTILTMWITALISILIFALSPHTVIEFGSIFITLSGFTVVALLIASATMLAMTFTGTSLSNISTALLILFFPRGLVASYIALVVANAGVVNMSDFGIFGDFGRNLIIGIFTNDHHHSLEQRLVYGMLYTIVLTVVYFVIAGYLFKKRHSELASHSGTRVSQPITRIIVTFTITLLGLAMFSQPGASADFLGVIIIYGIALISYFAYEFITMRKIAKMKSMGFGILVVLLLNLLFAGAVGLNVNLLLQEVDVNRVTSVEIVSTSGNGWNWSVSYAELKLRGLEITDQEFVELLVNDFNRQVFERRNTINRWFARNDQLRLTFNIDGGRNITRILHLAHDDDGNQIRTRFIDFEPYRAAYLLVPIEFDTIWNWGTELTREQQVSLLDSLREELPTVYFADWYERVGQFTDRHNSWDSGWIYNEETGEYFDPWQAWRDAVVVELNVTGVVDGVNFTSRFPITDLTPRTLELYQSYRAQQRR